ncbi:MAG: radical SAM protein [Candidatus Gastranaerophilales bacterium]|nr:radical SAM protein [Candidatus Gastranaerophilales bacterium]
MKICDNLNTSVCFNASSIGITYCTLTNATNGLGWPKLSDEVFDGNLIDWDKFFDARAKEIESIKNGTQRKECQNCQLISDEDFVDDKKIRYVLLSPWQVCNSNCIYCLGHVPPLEKDSPDYDDEYKRLVEPYDMINIIRDMISHNVLAENTEFDFAGGEPTLYPHFDELLNFLIDNGMRNIIIHTNNIQYSKAIEKGIAQNAVSLMISIDAGTKQCHEKVKRVKSYDDVWANFKLYSSVKPDNYTMKLCTKYVIVPEINDSWEEIYEFINQSVKNGATHSAINVYNQLLNNMAYEDKMLNHLYELSERFIITAKSKGLKAMTFPNIEYVYKKLGKKVVW